MKAMSFMRLVSTLMISAAISSWQMAGTPLPRVEDTKRRSSHTVNTVPPMTHMSTQGMSARSFMATSVAFMPMKPRGPPMISMLLMAEMTM